VHLLLDTDGRVQSGVIKWIARCPQTNTRFITASAFTMRQGQAPGRFAVRGRYRAHGHGFSERISISGRGRDHLSPPSDQPPSARWTGTFRVTAIVSHHGRHFDTCSTGRRRWRGRVLLRNDEDSVDATGSLVMTGDPGDYIHGGSTASYSAPPTRLSVLAYGRRIAAEITGSGPLEFWNVSLRGPAGAPLHTGTYPNATREAFSGNGTGLDVWGDGRGCNEVTGSFTINSLRLDRYYQVVSADISFEQHCEGGPAALHGRLIINL
jgi:hypothetical protein